MKRALFAAVAATTVLGGCSGIRTADEIRANAPEREEATTQLPPQRAATCMASVFGKTKFFISNNTVTPHVEPFGKEGTSWQVYAQTGDAVIYVIDVLAQGTGSRYVWYHAKAPSYRLDDMMANFKAGVQECQ